MRTGVIAAQQHHTPTQPGYLRPESRHCLTLTLPAFRWLFYFRLLEPSSTRLLVKSSRGPDPLLQTAPRFSEVIWLNVCKIKKALPECHG
nr:MAG TPA: hypothetical protein [Caudoviricetes sp.]